MVTANTGRDVRKEDARSEQKEAIPAQITTVKPRTSPASERNTVANVILQGSGKELREVPVAISDSEGHLVVPQPNDWVIVEFLARRGQAPLITGFVHNPDQLPPLAKAGHWRNEFRRENGQNLYVEAEPSDHSAGDPDVVRLGVKPDGLSDPTTEVAVDDSGGTTKVRIQTDGDITLDAGGDIVITEGGTTKKVLTEDAKFEYDDTQPDGSTSTKETTTVSNNEKTDVELSKQ